MKYKNIVEKLLYSAGGTDNILKVRRDRNNLVFVIWDDQLINVSNLDKLDLLKKYKIENMELILTFRYRDVNYIFDEIKAQPGSKVTLIPPSEEEINDKPFFERLKGSMIQDIFPLFLAMVLGGYLIGLITFVGRFFN